MRHDLYRRTAMATALWLALASLLSALASPLYAQEGNEAVFNVVLLVDESGSMWSETDKEAPGQPSGRAQAVQGLLAAMAGEPTNARFNVGIVTFGTTTRVVSPISPLREPGALQSKIDAFEQAHDFYRQRFARDESEFTDTLSGLREAYGLLFEGGNPRMEGRNAVLLLTDGRPETQQLRANPAGLPAYLEEVRAQALQLTGSDGSRAFLSTLLLIISNQAYGRESRDFWEELAAQTGGVECNYWEVNDRALLFHRTQVIMNCLLGEAAPPPPLLVLPRVPVSFGVEDYFKEITITIVKNNTGTIVQITRPDGRVLGVADGSGDQVKHNAQDLAESYRVTRGAGSSAGWAGCWTVSLPASDAGARVELVVNSYNEDYQLKLLQPGAAVWPVGKPLPFEVGLLRSTGEPADPAALRLASNLSLQVAAPQGSATLDLPLQGLTYKGVYSGSASGVYTFTGSIADEQLHQPSEATARCRTTVPGRAPGGGLQLQSQVTMRTLPWVVLRSPAAGSSVPNDNLLVEAVVMSGAQPYAGILPGRVEGSLRHRDTGRASPLTMSRGNEAGLYAGSPIGLVPGGNYTLTVSYVGRPAGSEATITDTVVVPISIVQGNTPTPIPTPTTPPTHTATPLPTNSPTAVPTATPTARPTDTPLPPATATPVPTAIPPPVDEGDGPWGLVLGTLAVLGLGGAGLLALRALATRPSLNGVSLQSDTGAAESLRGSRASKMLNGAQLLFTPLPGTGAVNMHIASSANQISVNGTPHLDGDNVPLNNGDRLTIGDESYTVQGQIRGAHAGVGGSDGVSSSGDYGGY